MTAIKIALKEIHKKEDKRWITYIDSQSSRQSMNNRENYPILNQIYDILAELQNQDKQIIQYKVLAHIGIKGNEMKQIKQKNKQ